VSGRLFKSNETLSAAKLNRALAAYAGSAIVTEAPSDGNQYVRQDGAWVLSGASVPARATIEDVTGTTQTPATGTDGRYFRCTNAAGCAVTIPTNAAQPFPTGTMLTYQQNGAVAVTFAAAGGVTLRVPAAYLAATAELYAVVQVVKVATNEWVIYGHLDPV
jgi:hypothetical protein